MNTIIERLSQIEERSVAIAAVGAAKKKALTTEYEERTRRFDNDLNHETEQKILALRDRAKQETGDRLRAQETEAAASIEALERLYDSSHKTWVDRLFQEMTGV